LALSTFLHVVNLLSHKLQKLLMGMPSLKHLFNGKKFLKRRKRRYYAMRDKSPDKGKNTTKRETFIENMKTINGTSKVKSMYQAVAAKQGDKISKTHEFTNNFRQILSFDLSEKASHDILSEHNISDSSNDEGNTNNHLYYKPWVSFDEDLSDDELSQFTSDYGLSVVSDSGLPGEQVHNPFETLFDDDANSADELDIDRAEVNVNGLTFCLTGNDFISFGSDKSNVKEMLLDTNDLKPNDHLSTSPDENSDREFSIQISTTVIIPSNHPYKVLWDVFTIALTFISACNTHMAIRDRSYEFTAFFIFTETWFVVDLILNFLTEHRNSDGTLLCDGRAVWARYLTTWFPIDMLSLIPWERMYIKPIIEIQNRRNVITKWFFRSKAVVKVTVRSLSCFNFSLLKGVLEK